MPNDTWKIVLVGTLLLGIELGAGNLIEIHGTRPDLLLIFTLVLTWRRGAAWGLTAGFLSGLAQDAFTIGFLGLFALSKSSLGFWIGKWFQNRDRIMFNWMWLILFTVCGFLQYLWYGMFATMESDFSYWSFVTSKALPAALYTGFIGWLWSLTPFMAHRDYSAKRHIRRGLN